MKKKHTFIYALILLGSVTSQSLIASPSKTEADKEISDENFLTKQTKKLIVKQ
ncbi:MAG: hypothetical protein IBJ00_04310 [Alphaproteobacteria bacterium]|nr:hypothetical protein [Alphaproteobacteria bacterium]